MFWKTSFVGDSVLILDISSGSVGAAIVDLQEDKLPTIVTYSRSSYFLEVDHNSEKQGEAILKCLKDALSRIGSKKHVNRALVSLSSPWVYSKIKNNTLNHTEGFILDQKTVANVLNDEEKVFKKELIDQSADDYDVFESKITNLTINGYEATLPQSKKAVSADMHFMMSATKSKFVQKIKKEITSTLGIKNNIVLENFSFAFMKVLSHAFPTAHSPLLINMNDFSTDFLFIKNNHPVVVTSVPVGSTTIVNEVSKSLGIPTEIARSYLALLSDGVLDGVISPKIEDELSKTSNIFKKACESFLKEFASDLNYQYRIFFVGRGLFENAIGIFLENAFSGHEIVVLGKDNSFTKEIVSWPQENLVDEKLAILSNFSNLRI
ncbi:MAG: hypothetical protein AB200_00965 [Parcubacteria bacterium C7867-005]|nr:MAG: hypothetical protein AB200_00965 [Parcubacteria bacterium C7867-005]